MTEVRFIKLEWGCNACGHNESFLRNSKMKKTYGSIQGYPRVGLKKAKSQLDIDILHVFHVPHQHTFLPTNNLL